MTGDALSERAGLAVLSEAADALEAAGIETARQDAEWLLASVLGLARFALYLGPDRELDPRAIRRYQGLVARRAQRVPLQHLLGFEDFHGLRLTVTPSALIPRPETEGLVEWALEILRDQPAASVADIGTGSGAIACALAKRLAALQVVGVERSLPALAVALLNVKMLGLDRRVKLLAGDLLAPFGPARFDLVVANPPYVPSGVVASLAPEVSGFEPREALDGGPDGMAVSRRIVEGAPSVLKRRGWLMMEIGEEQAGHLASLMAAEGFTAIQARRDLAGRERYIAGQWAEAGSPPPGRSC